MGSHDPLHCILPPGILHKLARHENEDIRNSAITRWRSTHGFAWPGPRRPPAGEGERPGR